MANVCEANRGGRTKYSCGLRCRSMNERHCVRTLKLANPPCDKSRGDMDCPHRSILHNCRRRPRLHPLLSSLFKFARLLWAATTVVSIVFYCTLEKPAKDDRSNDASWGKTAPPSLSVFCVYSEAVLSLHIFRVLLLACAVFARSGGTAGMNPAPRLVIYC